MGEFVCARSGQRLFCQLAHKIRTLARTCCGVGGLNAHAALARSVMAKQRILQFFGSTLSRWTRPAQPILEPSEQPEVCNASMVKLLNV